MITVWVIDENLDGRTISGPHLVAYEGKSFAELAPEECGVCIYGGEVIHRAMLEWGDKVPNDGAVLRFVRVPEGPAIPVIGGILGGGGTTGLLGSILGSIVNPATVTHFGSQYAAQELGLPLKWKPFSVGGALFGVAPNVFMGMMSQFGGLGGAGGSPLGLGAPLGSSQGAPSPTYSFGSIGNTAQNNPVVPVVYGEHRVGGPIIRVSSIAGPDKGETLRYSILLSEGPIEQIGKWTSDQNALESDGDPEGNHATIRLNDRPAYTIPGMKIWLRLGNDPQTGVYNQLRQRFQYGTVLDQGVTFKHVTQRPISGAVIIFRAPNGVFRVSDSGGRTWAEANFKVEFYNAAGQLVSNLGRNIKIRSHGAHAPRYETAYFENLPYGRYTIQVSRIGKERYTSDLRTSDKVDLYVVNEIGVYEYPTNQLRATLDVEVEATEDLQGGIPQTSVIIRGRKCYNAATGVTEWTRNPAWIIRDLLTNGRYGLGGRIDESEIDDDSFSDFADYCDALIPTASGFQQTPQYGDEQLLNNSFEDGTYTGPAGEWMSLNLAATNIDDWVVVGPATLSGSKPVQIDWKDFEDRLIDTAGSPGWGGVSQVVSLAAGTTYRFEVVAKRNPGWSSGNPPRFELDARAGTDVTAGTSLANQIFTAPPSSGAGPAGGQTFAIEFTPASTGDHVISIRHAAVASGDDGFHGCFIYSASVREILPPIYTPQAVSPLVLINGAGPNVPIIRGAWNSATKWGRFTVEITDTSGGEVDAEWTFIPDPELNLPNETYNTTHTDGSAETIAYGLTAIIDPSLTWNEEAMWEFDVLVEPRNRLDVVLDQRRSGFKWVQDLAKTARGIVMRIGSEYVMHIERQQTPIALFTEGANIIQDSLEITTASIGERNNTVEIQFLDRDDEYKSGAEIIEDEAVAGQIEDPRRSVLQMPGITRRSQAARMASFIRRLDRLQRKAISFEAGLDSVALLPGQCIKVSYNRQDYAWTGRVLAGTMSTIVLDREVTALAGRPYRYVERTQDGEFQQASFTVASDTTTDTLPIAPFDTDPAGNPYCLGVEDEESELYVVTKISGADGLRRRIEGVLYLDEIYSDDGNPVGVGQFAGSDTPAPNHVTNLAAVESIDSDTERSLVTITWDEPFPPADIYRVWVFVEGGDDWQLVGFANSGETSFVWDVLLPFGTIVDIRVQATNGGNGADFSTAPEVQIEIENDDGTLRTIPAAPASFTATPGSGTDVTLSWGSVAGADGYEVRAGTWSGGAVIYRGASTSVGVQATREANRYIVRAYTDDTIYSRASAEVFTAATALSGYATPAATYDADFDALADATSNTVVDDWHVGGRAIAQSAPALPASIITPATDLGSSAATHVSVEFRALTIPFVATQDLQAAPWYLSPEGDIDVRLSRGLLFLESSPDGSTWNLAATFMAADFTNETFGTDLVVTGRYFRWRVVLQSFAVAARNNPTVQEYRGLAAVERLRATYYRT